MEISHQEGFLCPPAGGVLQPQLPCSLWSASNGNLKRKVSVDAGFCKQIPLFINKSQYMLPRSCLYTTTDCSVGKHTQSKMQKASSAVHPGTTSSSLYWKNTSFSAHSEKGTCLLCLYHDIPPTTVSPFTCLGQRETHLSTFAPTAAVLLRPPCSLAGQQDTRSNYWHVIRVLQPTDICCISIRAALSPAYTVPDKGYAATALSTWKSHSPWIPLIPQQREAAPCSPVSCGQQRRGTGLLQKQQAASIPGEALLRAAAWGFPFRKLRFNSPDVKVTHQGREQERGPA